ncbi:MAG: LPS-assembly protein LptD [Cyanobacteria bacterium]|nr:LPS-assembly protein LptD [Cyanobacteriota bacterium]
MPSPKRAIPAVPGPRAGALLLALGLLVWPSPSRLSRAQAQSGGLSTPAAPLLPRPQAAPPGEASPPATRTGAAVQSADTAVPAAGAGMVTIESDRQQADNRTGIVTATGNVRIVYPEKGMVATARQAQYFSKEARLVLSGDVEVVDADGQRIRAERLVYLLGSERLQAEPASGRQVLSKIRLQSPSAPAARPPMP